MPPLLEKKQELIYNLYCASLYGIVLKISTNTQQAEEILVQTYHTYFLQNVKQNNCKNIFLQLLQTAICVSSEKLNVPKNILGKTILKNIYPIKLQL